MPDIRDREAAPQDGDVVGTILVPLHNHARFVAACLAGVVAAWRPGLEVLLVDDASADAGYAVAAAVLAEHPRIPVTVTRTAETLGHGNARLILALARGRFLIQCDSDDVPMPDRFAEIMRCFADDPACRLVTSNAMTIAEDGTPIGLFDTTSADETMADPASAAGRSYDTRWLGATAAYHRDVLEAFPSDPELCPYGLDLVTPLRALLLGTHRYIARPLTCYRLHAGNAHRLAGAHARAPAHRARYEALTLMALAQKLRDLAVHLAAPLADAPPAAPLVEAARRVFFDAFDRWSRSTVRAGREPPPAAAPAFLPAIPPIVTLPPGGTLSLASTEPFAEVVGRWSGFHPAEEWGCWCARAALVTLRVTGGGRRRLVLAIHASPHGDSHRLSLRIGMEPWVEVVLAPMSCPEIGLDLPDGGGAVAIVPLTIVSHDAMVPSAREADNVDHRLIGVALRRISLVEAPPAAGP